MEALQQAATAVEAALPRALAGDASESERRVCAAALQALGAVPVTLALLSESGLGKRARAIAGDARRASAADVEAAARAVVEGWKAQVAAESEATTPRSTAAAERPPAPAAAVEPGGEAPAAKRAKPGPGPSAPPVKASPAAAAAAPKRAPAPTGDPQREKLRELLAGALAVAVSEGASGSPADVAASVEVAMAALYADAGGAQSKDYKAKARQLAFNLKDSKNPDLRRAVLTGEVGPDELLQLTAEDLGSASRRQENRKIREHAMWECERGQAAVASTDQFQCGKCKKRNCTYFQMQTRSADEPMTTFVQCTTPGCNNRWRFC